jgi:ornithine cyclodeaminase/alanine dehydrogenase-like protein (mu-crystallin family)
MLILNKKDIELTVGPIDMLRAIEEAMLLQEDGDFNMPDRMHADYKGNVLLLMPCFADQYFSTKMISVFPKNKLKNQPSLHGSLVLNDGETGQPLALMDGAKLTALRTGAVGGLGLAYTSPKSISKIGLIGAGVQGFHQIIFAAVVRNLTEVYIHDPFAQNIEAFVEGLKKYLPEVKFIVTKTVEELLLNSEAIVTATTSKSPVLPNKTELFSEKSFIGIGSYTPLMREFPEAVFSKTNKIFVDTHFAKKECGDLIFPLA